MACENVPVYGVMATESPSLMLKDLQQRLVAAEEALQAALSQCNPSEPVAIASRQLLDIHEELRDLMSLAWSSASDPEFKPDSSLNNSRVARAAIAIEDEAHTIKHEFMDVVKALFLWKEDPVKRAKGDD